MYFQVKSNLKNIYHTLKHFLRTRAFLLKCKMFNEERKGKVKAQYIRNKDEYNLYQIVLVIFLT